MARLKKLSKRAREELRRVLKYNAKVLMRRTDGAESYIIPELIGLEEPDAALTEILESGEFEGEWDAVKLIYEVVDRVGDPLDVLLWVTFMLGWERGREEALGELAEKIGSAVLGSLGERSGEPPIYD